MIYDQRSQRTHDAPRRWTIPGAGSLRVGYGAHTGDHQSGGGDGIAVSRRVHASSGMICIDVAWLREIVASEDARELLQTRGLPVPQKLNDTFTHQS